MGAVASVRDLRVSIYNVDVWPFELTVPAASSVVVVLFEGGVERRGEIFGYTVRDLCREEEGVTRNRGPDARR